MLRQIMENDEFNTMKHTLLIVAIIISGTIIAAVVFDSFPLIIINVDDERIKTINAFAVDASLGVLTSIIFYYLLVYMGERKRVRIEEHDMLNWMKHNRKLMNAGELKEPRLGIFKELLSLSEDKRKYYFVTKIIKLCLEVEEANIMFRQ